MENKNHFYVIQAQENGKNYAYVETIDESINLKYAFSDSKIQTVNICDTKKQAEIMANCFNEVYKTKGTNLY